MSSPPIARECCQYVVVGVEPDPGVDFAAISCFEQRLAGFYAAIGATAVILIIVPGVIGILRHLP